MTSLVLYGPCIFGLIVKKSPNNVYKFHVCLSNWMVVRFSFVSQDIIVGFLLYLLNVSYDIMI